MVCKHADHVYGNDWCPVANTYCTAGKVCDFENNHQTNADRIRAMSDEELARFLADKITNETTLSWLRLYDETNMHSATEIEVIRYHWCRYLMQWLKQPAEE